MGWPRPNRVDLPQSRRIAKEEKRVPKNSPQLCKVSQLCHFSHPGCDAICLSMQHDYPPNLSESHLGNSSHPRSEVF